MMNSNGYLALEIGQLAQAAVHLLAFGSKDDYPFTRKETLDMYLYHHARCVVVYGGNS